MSKDEKESIYAEISKKVKRQLSVFVAKRGLKQNKVIEKSLIEYLERHDKA
ncbi:hypothetical protein [Priestia megaterium]|uniref:hypothetical protein n=1 Tax=Priestia megaterium TaxID=1404 RepID=UPI001482C436|nr:hypothetical protein [Priestia megaterium]